MVKRILLITILILIIVTGVSCNKHVEPDDAISDQDFENEQDEIDPIGSWYDLIEFLSETYDSFGNLVEGLMLVEESGYYGYVDERGDLVIPTMFVSATDFYNNRAVVSPTKEDGKNGVIDREGNYILEPKYGNIEILDEFILTRGSISQYLSSDDSYLLFDLDGKEIISDYSSEILIGDNNRITAKIYDKENMNYRYSTIFDYEGNKIAAFENRVDIGKFANGFATKKDLEGKNDGASVHKRYHGIYTYIDIDGNKVTDDYFVKATNFEDGMAIVIKGLCLSDGTGIEDPKWSVINDKFETIYEFNYLNEYIAQDNYNPRGYTYNYTPEGLYHDFIKIKIRNFNLFDYIMVDRSTESIHGPFKSFEEILEVDGIIVLHKDTGLYGLYVNGILVEEPKYNNIVYAEDGVFVLEQGTEITYYTVE